MFRKTKTVLFIFLTAFLLSFGINGLVFSADREADFNTHTGSQRATSPNDSASNDSEPCTTGNSGSPVYLQNMEFIWSDTDIVLSGRPTLSLTRHFRSFNARDGIFGKGWSTRCEKSLVKTIRSVNEGKADPASAGKIILSNNGILTTVYVYTTDDRKNYEFYADGNGGFTAPAGMPDVKITIKADNNHPRLTFLDGSYEEYNAVGQLIEYVDRNGNAVKYTYQESALVSIADDNGRFLKFTYDGTGHVTTVADHTNRQWQYAYDGAGNLLSVTNPVGGVYRYEYQTITPTGSGQSYDVITRIIDEADVVVTSVTYNNNGKVRSYTVGSNRYTYRVNDTFTGQTGGIYTNSSSSKKVISTGQTSSFGTAPSGIPFTYTRQVTKTDSSRSTWIYLLDDFGRIVEMKPPINQILAANRQAGVSEKWEYNDQGKVTKYTDLAGTEFNTSYDELGRITSTTDPDGTTTINYDGNKPWPVKITSPSGRVSQLEYDARGNPLVINEPSGEKTKMAWSAKGDLLSITDQLDAKTTIIYNNIGLPTKLTGPLNNSVSMEYDQYGNVKKVVNPLGNSTDFAHDLLDRVVTQTNALGHTVTVAYDEASKVASVTAPNQAVIQYVYDQHGRLSKRTDYDGKSEVYRYHSNNLISRRTQKDNSVISYSYDRERRLIKLDPPGNTAENGDNSIQYTYSVLDDLLTATSPDGQTSYTYDAMSRVRQETNNGVTVSYTYNNEGEVTSQVALGKTLNFSYDTNGNLVTIATPFGDFNYAYNAANRRTRLAYPNGDAVEYVYNAGEQLTAQNFSGSYQASFAYVYDDAGQLISQTGGGKNNSYSYDPISRLIASTDALGTRTYQYDEMGNHTDSGQVYDVANRLLEDNSFTYQYDRKGNLLSKRSKVDGNTSQYTWNSLNELVNYQRVGGDGTVIPESVTSYVYGPLGKRLSKVIASNKVNYAYAYIQRIRTSTATGDSFSVFGPGVDEALLTHNGTDTSYFYNDYKNSVISVSNVGGNRENPSYGAFGEGVNTGYQATAGVDFSFTGREREDNGMYYYRARYYDSNSKRFLSEDSYGLAAGDPNYYAYALNDPINNVDPSGHIVPACVLAGIGGAAFGFLFDAGLQAITKGTDCINFGQSLGAAAIDGAIGGLTCGAGALISKVKYANGALDGATFAQKTFSRNFSEAGKFAGQSVDGVAGALRAGNLKPSDIPIDYIVRNGNTLILNTRSSQALTRAGIPRSRWNAVNRTGDAAFEARLTGQLQRNNLTDAGISTVRQSGGR